MTTDMWITLVLGIVVGFWLGRRWAEIFGARFNMSQTWRGRKRYRD